MISKNKVKADFNKSALQYDNYAALQYQTTTKLLEISKDNFTGEKILIDLGCGTGYFYQLAKESFKHSKIIQLDLSMNMCKLAKSNTETVNADIDQLCFANNTIDGAFSNLALQWSPNLIGSLQQINNLLKPNKYLYFSIFGPNTLTELNYCFQQVSNLTHINKFLSLEELIKNLQISDFTNIKIIKTENRLFFPTSLELMHYLKKIGASYKNNVQNSLNKNKLQQIEQIYQQNYSSEHGLVSSWEIFYLSAQKNEVKE